MKKQKIDLRIGLKASAVTVVLSLMISTLVLLIFFFSGYVAQVLSDSFVQTSPEGAFQYAVKHRDGAAAEIEVMFDLDNQEALSRYLQTNEERSKKLLSSAQGERLWTTITFVRPLTAQELQALLREVAIEPASYTLVGWTETGERMGSTIFADATNVDFNLKKAVQSMLSTNPDAPDYGAQMVGFMVVDGYIMISELGLGKLMSDERVLLVDTTAYEVQKLAGVEKASVRLPTPFWDMEWRVGQ